MGSSCFYVLEAVPGVPAGFLFLLLVTPLSKEVVKGSEEGDGAVEVVVLSSMDEDFVGIWWLYGGVGEAKQINL